MRWYAGSFFFCMRSCIRGCGVFLRYCCAPVTCTHPAVAHLARGDRFGVCHRISICRHDSDLHCGQFAYSAASASLKFALQMVATTECARYPANWLAVFCNFGRPLDRFLASPGSRRNERKLPEQSRAPKSANGSNFVVADTRGLGDGQRYRAMEIATE